MSEVVQIVSAICSLAATIFSMWITYRIQVLKAQVGRVDDKVEEVHRTTNSMKDALVEATRKEAFAAGKEEQRLNPSP